MEAGEQRSGVTAKKKEERLAWQSRCLGGLSLGRLRRDKTARESVSGSVGHFPRGARVGADTCREGAQNILAVAVLHIKGAS